MLAFYFLTFLFLLQIAYWIGLLGLHFCSYPIVKFLLNIYHQWGIQSRLFLVVYFTGFSPTSLKEIVQIGIKKGKKGVLFLIFWLFSLGCFIVFDHINMPFCHPSDVFLLLFCLSFAPFFIFRSSYPSVSIDKPSPVRPTLYHKNSPLGIALHTSHGLLPINHPQRGICIIGSAGSGKTRYILEPILHSMIDKGYCGIVYDYDFESHGLDSQKSYCLSKFVYNCYRNLADKTKLRFHVINFIDPSKSIRINPISPVYISNRAYLSEYVTVLLHNLYPSPHTDFWQVSVAALLKSMIVYLSNRFPSYCTLPHVLILAMQPIDKMLRLLQEDQEACLYASSIFDAAKCGEQSMGQLMGVVASFKTMLQPLLSKELFWILSGNDVSLTVNDPKSPTLLCIGNHPPSSSAFSPIIALLLSVSCQLMYSHGRQKSFIAIDELPTLYLPRFAQLPATGRKYGIATIGCLQSIAQLEKCYNPLDAKAIQENLSNQFVGQCGAYSAGYGTTLFGQEEQTIRSISTSDSHQSERISTTSALHLQEKNVIHPQDFSQFNVGHFVGKVVESNASFFQSQFTPVSSYDHRFKNEKLAELPNSSFFHAQKFEENQQKITKDITYMIKHIQ